jgi:hypothetical protein
MKLCETLGRDLLALVGEENETRTKAKTKARPFKVDTHHIHRCVWIYLSRS